LQAARTLPSLAFVTLIGLYGGSSVDILELVKDLFQFSVECVVYAITHDPAAQSKFAEIVKDLGISETEVKKP
jgi:hypothetical protein